ncbi:MAG: NAD-binding protein [Isosphaeraceae bacterium]
MAQAGTGLDRTRPSARRTWPTGSFFRRRQLRRLMARWRRHRGETERVREPEPFWWRLSVRRMFQGVLVGCVVVVLGVVGYILLGWSVSDAIYMVMISVSGVGYGEVRPLRTNLERLHTILVIVFGMVAVGYTLGRFIQILAEGEIQDLMGHRRMRRQIEMLEGHTVVAGFGRVGALVCDGLVAAEIPFVVVEVAPERVQELEMRGYLYVAGDATEEQTLRNAGLERARALVTVMPTDAANVFITLTARQMAPKVMIVARAEQPSTLEEAPPGRGRPRDPAGPDRGTPDRLAAHEPDGRRVRRLRHPAVEPGDRDGRRADPRRQHIEGPVAPRRRHRPADRHHRDRREAFRRPRPVPPPGDEALATGDSIVVLGRRGNLDQFRKLFES